VQQWSVNRIPQQSSITMSVTSQNGSVIMNNTGRQYATVTVTRLQSTSVTGHSLQYRSQNIGFTVIGHATVTALRHYRWGLTVNTTRHVITALQCRPSPSHLKCLLPNNTGHFWLVIGIATGHACNRSPNNRIAWACWGNTINTNCRLAHTVNTPITRSEQS